MALSSSPKHDSRFDLLNAPRQEDERFATTTSNGGRNQDLKEEISSSPNYTFQQPIDRIGHSASNSSIMLEIDQTVKRHADNLLHALEGVNARLSNLEIKTWDIENSVDDLKESIVTGNGKRRLRKLEIIAREVQEAVQGLKERQETVVAPQVTELQSIEGEKQSENRNSSTDADLSHDEVSTTNQSHQSFDTPITQPLHQLPVLPPPLNTFQHQVQQKPDLVQSSSKIQIASTLENKPYFPTPEQYQLPPTQQLQAHPPAPHQQYQSLHQLPLHSQTHQLSQQHPPTIHGNASPLVHHPEESKYMPRLPQPHHASIHQLPSMAESISFPLLSQQFHGAPASMYMPSPSRCSTVFSSGLDQSSGISSSDSYGYGSFPQYHSAAMQSPQNYSSSPNGGSSYPTLPTAQVLPHSKMTDRSADGGSGTSETGNQMPVDHVAEKVVMMGFSKGQVTAAIKELTDNGMSVDLNVVLDKLMSDGETKPKKGWFRR